MFANACLLIKRMRTSQTAQSGAQQFVGRISNPFFLCIKTFDQKLPDAIVSAAFLMFELTILFSYLFCD